MIRKAIPYSLAPLAVLATALSSAMWLRAFPFATLGIPLFGAAVLSVLVASVVVLLTRRSMLITAPISLLVFLGYALLVVLRDPIGLSALVDGFVHGPARLLSFALPLVSPRSLMLWPVALCWLAGMLSGESLARSRISLLPYGIWLAVFAVGYAGGSRAMGPDVATAHRVDLAVGAGLLLVLVLLRVAQGWLEQDRSSEAAGQVEAGSDAASLNLIPLQRITAGVLTALVVVAAAGYAASNSVFAGPPTQVKRVPSVITADPTTPMAYVAALRPTNRKDPGTALFDVTVDRRTPGYLGLASVDYYDGDSWTFTRDFRPSGGVVPADSDPDLDPSVPAVTQQYRITSARLTSTPWMPSLFRPAKVTGTPVSVDPVSGMIVPTGQLSVGARYQVRSVPASHTLTELPPSWLPATSAPPIDTQLPGTVRTTLAPVITGFGTETGRSAATPNAYLQALINDLRSNYLLADPASPTGSGTPATSQAPTAGKKSPTKNSSSKNSPGRKATATPKPSAAVTAAAPGSVGGTSFSAVLAAILGPSRSGTPEQYATLVALIARDIGVPARIVSGFRVPSAGHLLTPGTVTVTSADAYSWVEVPVRGAGWVVLDPSPARYSTSEAQPSVGVTKSSTPSRSPSQAALVTESNGGHAVAPKSTVHTAIRQHRSIPWLLITLAVLAVVLFVLAFLLGRRWLRRIRRQRSPDARTRVIGAWQETLDVLTESGLGDLRTLTGAEVGSATRDRYGDAPAGQVRVIADAAAQAAFSSQSVVVARDAAEAWTAHAELRKAVRLSLPVTQRLLFQVRYTSRRRTRTGSRTRPGLPSARRSPAGRRRKH